MVGQPKPITITNTKTNIKMQNLIPGFQPLVGLYEPSAIQQLPDGRFLLVEDEQKHSFSLVTLGAGGVSEHKSLEPGWFQSGDPFWKLDDLEGLALDSQGYLYAVTSHSRNDGGEQKKARDKLVRFRIDGDRVVKPVVVDGLKPALVAAHPLLAAAAEIQDVKALGGLNVEALEITPDRQSLLLGFRSPLQGALAVIATVENPKAVFEAGAEPVIGGTLQLLDLGGQGIRGMAYVASLAGYLIISGPTSREKDDFKLWFWKGQANAPARRVTVTGLQGLERAEGVSPAVIDGVQRIVIVSDDGDRTKGRFARFLLLEPEQLQIEP